MVRPQTLFEMFGHECDMKVCLGNVDKPAYNTGREKKPTKKQYFKRWRMINETNKAGYNFLRSYKKIENEYKKQLKYPYVIHPFSDFRWYWESFMMIILNLQFYMICLDIAKFNSIYKEKFAGNSVNFYFTRLITDIFSFIDIGVQFFCGYIDKKNSIVVLNPMKIFKHYLFPKFIIDLLCSFPGDFLLYLYEDYVNENYSIGVIYGLHFLGFIKLIRFATFVKYARNISEGNCSYYIHKMVIAFITFITYIHVICCFSIAWNSWENPMVPGDFLGLRFKNSYGFKPTDSLCLYVRFFYCACFLVLNAGYGFHNNTTYAIIFTIIIWLASRLSYIIAIAYFMRLHISVYSSHQKYIDMVSEVTDYMQHKQVPLHLRKRILAYYDIKFQNTYFREVEILLTVSGQLKQEIVMHKCKQMVQNAPFFQNIPLTLLIRIVSNLRNEIFLTNDVIVKSGAIGHCMYFISKGTVALYTKSGREICHLEDNEYFGEAALVINNSVRSASVIAVEVCELYRLDRSKFIKSILPYPDLLEKIKYTALEKIIETNVPEEILDHHEKLTS